MEINITQKRAVWLILQAIACLLLLASYPHGARALESDDFVLYTQSIGDATSGLSLAEDYDVFSRTESFQEYGVSEDFIVVPLYIETASSSLSSAASVSSASSLTFGTRVTDDGGKKGGSRKKTLPPIVVNRRRVEPLHPAPVRPSSVRSIRSVRSSASNVSSARSNSSKRCPGGRCPTARPSTRGQVVPISEDTTNACKQIVVTHPALMPLLFAMMGGMCVAWSRPKRKGGRARKPTKKFVAKQVLLMFIGIVLIMYATGPAITAMLIPNAHAADTVPAKHVYNGHLLTKTGTPAQGSYSIRFSQWKSEDKVDGDASAGAINTSAPNYASWSEVHTVTPDARGFFSVILGEQMPLPAPAQVDLFLQVEVKNANAADASYQLLDVNPADAAKDRSPVLSLPFTRNADLLDYRDIGTGSGTIPLLGSGGRLPVSTTPGGTNNGTFVIDAGNTQTEQIDLQFGTSLAKQLSYDLQNLRFEFNDDVHIEGDLTVTGLINGVDVANFQDATGTQLRVSSGAGLTIIIQAGNYRLNGQTTNFAGGSGIAVPDNATSYVFFGSGGLAVRAMPFPADESMIPLAVVVTSGGGIATVADRRILQNDDREREIVQVFHPQFPNASYEADGTDNVGQLSVDFDDAAKKNYYRWVSSRETLQDYAVVVKIRLPENFMRWSATPLSVGYASTTANAAENALSIAMFDTAGQAVTLSGAASGLASVSWTTADPGFSGSPAWTPGGDVLLKLTLAAKSGTELKLADLQLTYVTMDGL